MLAGVFRSSIALAVVLLEGTGQTRYLLPILITTARPPPSCPRHFPCAAVVLTLPRRQSKTSWRPEMRLRAGTRSTTSRSTRLDLRWCRWRPD